MRVNSWKNMFLLITWNFSAKSRENFVRKKKPIPFWSQCTSIRVSFQMFVRTPAGKPGPCTLPMYRLLFDVFLVSHTYVFAWSFCRALYIAKFIAKRSHFFYEKDICIVLGFDLSMYIEVAACYFHQPLVCFAYCKKKLYIILRRRAWVLYITKTSPASTYCEKDSELCILRERVLHITKNLDSPEYCEKEPCVSRGFLCILWRRALYTAKKIHVLLRLLRVIFGYLVCFLFWVFFSTSFWLPVVFFIYNVFKQSLSGDLPLFCFGLCGKMRASECVCVCAWGCVCVCLCVNVRVKT